MDNVFIRKYNSFSGVDIKAFFEEQQIGTLQGISYQILRTMAPVYTMGSMKPKGLARLKRTITGSIVFAEFDHKPLKKIAYDTCKSMEYSEQQLPWHLDEVSRFDIVMTVANEYGCEQEMKILGVKLLNDEKALSIDDIVSEESYYYTANAILGWMPTGRMIEKQDNHEGMIQNPITGEWRWF